MNPYNSLTEEDKELITEFCTQYAKATPANLQVVLKEWNNAKKTLYRGFGNKLRIKFHIKTKMEKIYHHSLLENLYTPLYWRWESDIFSWKKNDNNHPFINAVGVYFKYLYEQNVVNLFDLRYLSDFMGYTSIEDGFIQSGDHIFMNGNRAKLHIPRGTKPMKAIRKVLTYYDFPFNTQNLIWFNDWRDKISLINTDKEIEANLVFSIHPIDYMTMSDNNCGWRSCMSWVNEGGYSAGTIEMMNSNVAIVAYLEDNNKKYIYNNKEIPNKSWRTLVFAHKDILLVGKHYHYQSKTLAMKILDLLQEQFASTLGWKYQYKKQRYYDLIKYTNNNYVSSIPCCKNKHKIYCHMGAAMYNDMLHDHGTQYWCCRNWVPKTLNLSLSGKYTCMCCGDEIYVDNYDYYSDDEDGISDKVCWKCESECSCMNCLKTSTDMKDKIHLVKILSESNYQYNKNICEDCLINEYWFEEKNNLFINKEDLSYIKRNRYVIFELPENLTVDNLFDKIKETDMYKDSYNPNWYGYIDICYKYKNKEEIQNLFDELNIKVYKIYNNPISIDNKYSGCISYCTEPNAEMSIWLCNFSSEKEKQIFLNEEGTKKVIPVTKEMIEDYAISNILS